MILMNDFSSEDGALIADFEAAMARVVRSGWYVLGDENRAFCEQWARMCGVKHAVGLANGLDAIEVALRALDIGAGDEVITTGMTAFATVLAILRAGATPVLADIDPATGLLAPSSVRRCISKKTRAVVPVHLYGQIGDMSEWATLTQEAGILLVEDCAQAHLARYNGQVAGSFGVAGAYSFYPTKNLGAFGDAGALISNDANIAERAARIRNYGQSDRYHHVELGLNSRLDEIQAAVLSVKLGHLDDWTRRRRAVAKRYHAELASDKVTPLRQPADEATHVYHLFVVTCENRDALQRHLAKSGVQTHAHYPVPVHHQPICTDIKRDPEGLAHTERHALSCLSLPCHPHMSEEQVSAVIGAVNRFAG